MAKQNNNRFKILCIGVVAFSAVATIVFVALGGGEGIQTEKTLAEGFNSSLPDANVESVSDDRVKAARLEDERRKRDEMLQINGSSFGLLEIEEKKSEQEDMDSLARVMAEQTKADLERQLYTQEETAGSVSNVPEFASSPKETTKTTKKKSTAKDRAYKDAQEIYGKELFPDKVEEKKVAQETPKTEVKKETKKKGSFNSLDRKSSSVAGNSIRAVVHGTHKDLTESSKVKFRLLDPMEIDGVTIPRHSFVYGTVSFSGARAIINIDNINYENSVLPFKGEIYDGEDGSRGISAPDNAVNDAAKEAGDGAINETPAIPSSHGSAVVLASNLANRGAIAIKNTVSKGVRKQKLTISDNYKVLIKKR
jgi:conjugative transposon TraM protein